MQAFFIFSYLAQSTAKYFKPVHPHAIPLTESQQDLLRQPPPPPPRAPPFSFSLGKSPENEVEPCSKVC